MRKKDDLRRLDRFHHTLVMTVLKTYSTVIHINVLIHFTHLYHLPLTKDKCVYSHRVEKLWLWLCSLVKIYQTSCLFSQESVSCVTPVKRDSFVYSCGGEDTACGTSQGNFPGEFGSKGLVLLGQRWPEGAKSRRATKRSTVWHIESVWGKTRWGICKNNTLCFLSN